MFVANSSIKASRDKYDVRGKVPEVTIKMRIVRKIVVRIVMRIRRLMVRIKRIMVGIMWIKRIMIPDARISVTEAMDDRSNDTDGTN